MALADLVEETIKLLVDEPDSVVVTETKDRGTVVFTVSVAPGDVGRVIGKEGRVVSCLRQLVSAVGAKHRTKTVVKVKTED